MTTSSLSSMFSSHSASSGLLAQLAANTYLLYAIYTAFAGYAIYLAVKWVHFLPYLVSQFWYMFLHQHDLIYYVYAFLYFKYHVSHFVRHKRTIPDVWINRLRKSPNHPALEFEGKTYTFKDLDVTSNRIAEWALEEGIQPRDVVALDMENCYEFLAIWLGLAKIGAIIAMVNTNLKGDSLFHSFTVIDAKTIISDRQCSKGVAGIQKRLLEKDSEIKCWVWGGEKGIKDLSTDENKDVKFKDLTKATDKYRSDQTDLPTCLKRNDKYTKIRREAKMQSSDLLFYIYTSGTTGLPKAAKIKHTRMFMAGQSFVSMHNLGEKDKLYVSMPLYHSAAGMIGVGVSWFAGVTIVMRRKFSAKAFMEDCSKHQVTVIQYIGQIARYLLATPQSEYDTNHRIQKAIGNGMPGDCWQEFMDRFHIPYVGEFYASTEGNASLVNTQNKVGAMGYMPWIATFFYPIRIVKFKFEEEEPYRNKYGYCEAVLPGQVGELINAVSETDPIRSFDGYTNEKANQDKLIKNVFRKGDLFFRTGDLVKQDAQGFIYFVDRIGDTFRWKGENVATTEVADRLSDFDGFGEVNVYGVAIPKNDGKAGMASVVLDGYGRKDSIDDRAAQKHKQKQDQGGNDKKSSNGTKNNSNDSDDGSKQKQPSITPEEVEKIVDTKELYNYVKENLASYQQPVFFRFQPEMETTGTFKSRKVDIQKEGYDIEKVTDPVYFRDDKQKNYILVDEEVYKGINDGKYRV